MSLILITFLVLSAACSSSDDDEAEPTASVGLVASPTATLVSATFTPAPTRVPTATPPPPPTVTATQPGVRPSPTPVVLPSGGDELTLFGRGISQIVAADVDGLVLYAVSGSRLARSPDGGVSWYAQGRTVPGRIVPALDDPDLLYAGDLDSCAISVLAAPLSVSVDGGRFFEQIEGVEGIMPLLVDAGEPNVLVGTNCTLQISVDGGATWQFVPPTSGFDVRVAVSRERHLDGEIAVLGTSEGGSSVLWAFDLSTPGVVVELGELATFWGFGGLAWLEDRIVLATATGVGVSDDAGDTWTWSRSGLEDATYSVDPLTESIPADEAERVVGFQHAVMDPSNPERIWVAGSPGLFRSDDGGATWQRLGEITNVDGLALSTASDRVYAVAEEHAYVWTLDGR